MALTQDMDLGLHKGRRRVFTLGTADIQINAVNLAAGAFTESQTLYAPGFVHFMGRLVATTPAATTITVQMVDPFIAAGDTITLATLTPTANAAVRGYQFYWGVGRGVLVGSRGTTFCFDSAFKLRVRNSGGNPVNVLTVESIECS